MKWVGFFPDGVGGIYPSATAVVLGLTYNFLPFMTLPIYASLERVDPRLVEAAGDQIGRAHV